MSIEEILYGESKNIEFKEFLPSRSLQYMKTVVAFANGSGGKIIFGIADQSHTVTGIAKDEVFRTMDAIANAISDSCEPAIIPDISLQTIDEKTVIIVEISEGRQRPYFIKSLGRENGVYIRIAGTTRLADEYMVKELLFEGSNRCFDQSLNLELSITDNDVERLCSNMKDEALKNAENPEQKASIRNIGIQQLLSWGILVEKDGKLYPTNAYAILTGLGPFPFAMQCGVFKGTTKAVFVDRREYDGPIWEQIEQAYQFVLRNIHLGAVIKGLYRQDVYEIPPSVIRELIINASIHRSYLDHGNIQIAIYDDRLEVTSPGKLPMGQTLERMKEGRSRIRNEALAHAFSYMNLIEHWGSGIPRMIEQLEEAGLREPEFIGGEVDLRVSVYRGHIEVNDLESDLVDRKNGLETKLLKLIQAVPESTHKTLGAQLGISPSTVKRLLNKLQQEGIVIREGSNRKGKWLIHKKE